MASGKFKGDHIQSTLLPSTFRDGHKVGCHLLLFTASRDFHGVFDSKQTSSGRFPNHPPGLPNAPGAPSKRDGKNPMAKWISRLLSVHAVVRSAHDACCTLTSEYVTNSECWSPCSNVAETEGWMGLVRKNEGFSSKDFYPQKKRVLEDADEMDSFFFWY